MSHPDAKDYDLTVSPNSENGLLFSMEIFGLVKKGGPGSGHHGHRGRPGEVGGSLPGGRVQAIKAVQKGLYHFYQAEEVWGDKALIDQDEAIKFFEELGYENPLEQVGQLEIIWIGKNRERMYSPHEVIKYASVDLGDEYAEAMEPLYRPRPSAKNIEFGLDNREADVIASLHDVERDIIDDDLETAFVILSDTGEIVFEKQGDRDSVTFTAGEAAQTTNAIVVHNHPSGKPPSQEDFNFALDDGMSEMHAISDETGRHIMRFNTTLTQSERDLLKQIYWEEYRKQKVLTDKKFEREELTSFEAWTELQTEVLYRVEKQKPKWFDYIIEPSPLQKEPGTWRGQKVQVHVLGEEINE